MFKNVLVFILFSISTCFAVDHGGLQYAYWNPFGKQLFNESMNLQSANSAESSVVTMLLDQTEPVSFILHNPGNDDIKVQSISVINSTKSDNLRYDVKIVKQWYIGLTTNVHPTKDELKNPTLKPELLVKNDNLIIADNTTKKNYIQILESGQIIYQDISTPIILMPNNAIVNDSYSLQPFVIKAQSSKQVWVSITTNNLTHKGMHNLKVTVNYEVDNHKKSLIVPIKILVLPILLHGDKLNHSIYYTGQLRADVNRLLSTPKSESQYIAELTDLKEHGILYPTQYLDGDNESTIARYISIRNELELPCDKVYFLGGAGALTQVSLDFNIKKLESIVINNSMCKKTQIYLYGIDEARGEQLIAESKSWEIATRSGGLVFAASNQGDLTKHNMLSNLNILILSNIKNTQDKLEMRKLGKDVYLYGQPQTGIPDPFIYRQNYGYYLIKNDYTGAMPFAYQFGFPEHMRVGDLSGGLCFSSKTGYCSIWNNFDDSIYYDHMFTYPTTNGVIDTVQWEGYAAAITDTRYYYTLVDLMKTRCTLNDARCNFDPISLIDVEDPGATREQIIKKIKLFINKD